MALAIGAILPVAAPAHQTLSDGGATVTLHVNPDDEPIAGKPATIDVAKVAVRRHARFRWRTCNCALTITDPLGTVIDQRPLGRTTRISLFTFPAEGAYQLAVSGRYRKQRRWRPFTVRFGIRAIADPAAS